MILKIKDKLRDNSELIIDILNKLNCEYIKPPKNNEIRWGHSNAHKLNIETLSYADFSANSKGDIITMVSLLKNIELGQAIKWLAKELNLSYEYSEKTEVTLPFGGFFKQYSKVKDNDTTPPVTYPMEKLNEYEKAGNLLWVEDGISLKTQEYFGIRFDHNSDRIIIPHFNESNELVGCVGRINKKEIDNKINKYIAPIPFSKSKNLYGLNNNYKNIQNSGTLYIFEAEKSTMLMHEYGMDISVSLGGKEIHPRQKELIKSLYLDSCILCLDEGVTEEEIIAECKKIQILNPFFKNKIGYIYDKDNKYMKEGSKCSPIDLGLEVFLKLLKEYLIWI